MAQQQPVASFRSENRTLECAAAGGGGLDLSAGAAAGHGSVPRHQPATITVHVCPTTGGQVDLQVPRQCSVLSLKKQVASKIKVPKDRIVLLHKNRQLVDGTLEDNHIPHKAKLTLLPSVETGILAQKPEHSVLQALESLTDTQVDNFLTGKAPLNLTIRLGDHMMFIQLQLSTVGTSILSHSSASTTASLPTPPHTPTLPASPLPFTLPVTSGTASSAVASPPTPPASPVVVAPTSCTTLNGNGSNNTKSLAAAEFRPVLDTKALADASRNLTQTLRQFSSAALGKKVAEKCESSCCQGKQQGGAVIESMYHHGRGVYSGTFSGTLSPALQDKDGRPRRDIGTIIHILNDLLGASSQCRSCYHCDRANRGPDKQLTASSMPSISTCDLAVTGRQDENEIMRGKVEQLQTMLQERRRRRKARRDVRCTPYRVGQRSLVIKSDDSHSAMDCSHSANVDMDQLSSNKHSSAIVERGNGGCLEISPLESETAVV